MQDELFTDKVSSFVFAACKGDLQAVSQFLKDNVDNPDAINAKDYLDNAALNFAISYEQPVIIDLLLSSKSIDINITDALGWTPLFCAVVSKDAATVERLLKAGANPNIPDNEGVTPLNVAIAQFNDDRIVELLLADSRTDRNLANKMGFTPLDSAIMNDDLTSVDRLLRAGADPNISNSSGEGALHYAITVGRDEIVTRLLLDDRTNMNMPDMNGETPLHYAVMHRVIKAVDALLNAGANPNVINNDGESPLQWAIENGYMKIVLRMLADDRTDPNFTDEDGNTLLHLAILWDEIIAVEALLIVGADPNAINLNGETALHFAAYQEVDEHTTFKEASGVTKLLLEHKADPHRTDHRGETALHIATLMNNIPAARLLLNAGVNPAVANHHGDTALHVAADNDSHDLTYILLETHRGRAVVDASNHDGDKPLILAAMYGNTDCVSALLANGANPNSVNNDGETALHWAVWNSDIHIITRPFKAGADFSLKTRDGETALSWADNDNIREAMQLLEKFNEKRNAVDLVAVINRYECVTRKISDNLNTGYVVRHGIFKTKMEADIEAVTAVLRFGGSKRFLLGC